MNIEEIISRLEFVACAIDGKKGAKVSCGALDAKALRSAIALLKTHPEAQPNEPLTLEELRGMGGQPYWHVGLQKDSPPPHWNILEPFYAEHINDYGYGKRWLAYRRPPKED